MTQSAKKRKRPAKTPTVALIYDFDGTLSPMNMQEYDFFSAIGIKTKEEFWDETTRMQKDHNASNILCYMKQMLDKSRAANLSIKRRQFKSYGQGIELYDGVKEWFGKINQLGRDNGVKIEHYINSSGLEEMIEGTPIAKEFKRIFASRFMYVDDVAVWPAVAVDFTTKTQFLFMINKGIENIYENNKVNEFVEDKDRPVPFAHMIYFGDGDTDVPCMRLVKMSGGNSIAVYKPRNAYKKEEAEKLVKENRVNFACSADYREGGEMYKIVEAIIRQVKLNYDFDILERDNQKKFGKEE